MRINNNFPSPNYDIRNKKIQYIIVHFTEMSFDGALRRLTDEAAQVSAHYIIKENGEIFQLVADENIAWHAGKSSWYGEEALNRNSIGIELDNLGNCRFAKAQMQACLALSNVLVKKYDIPPGNFIGHSDVAPERKIDPGIFFDWEFFAKNGLGIWHNLQAPDKVEQLFKFGDKGEEIKHLQQDLKKLGYDIKDTGIFDVQTNFVIRAFQSKFYPEIIHRKGIDFYNNDKSQYSWDLFSKRILNKLLA